MEENEELIGQEERPSGRWLWLVGGCALSVTTLCSLVLFMLLLISTSINAYLAWTMSGYEISISRPGPSTVIVVITPSSELAMAPTTTPTATSISTPTPTAAPSTLEIEFATLAAVATQVEEEAASSAVSTPTTGATGDRESAGVSAPEAMATLTATPAGSQAAADTASSLQSAVASTNSYDLIPIVGGRESRPPDQHADLNLKLRDPQPADFDTSLVEIPGSGIDPQAPKLSSVFEPDFARTYAAHDWDWGCNCKGDLMTDGKAVLVGIKTTPGESIFIPKTERDIYEGKYHAVVLYAAEDTLTMQYARRGSVVEGYTVHYLGLRTDPNLVALFQESEGSELPGLTLDVPVGVATDELIVAMRDNGMFLDARSKRDWWD